jgi:hypothetical protein
MDKTLADEKDDLLHDTHEEQRARAFLEMKVLRRLVLCCKNIQ